MNDPLKANLVISGVMGAIVAGIAALLGSEIWWLFGLIFAGLEFVAIAVVQVGNEGGEA